MAEVEPRIVLFDQTGEAKEVNPTGKPGSDNQLASIRAALAAGLEAGLLEASPFIPKPEVTPAVNQGQVTEGSDAPAQISRLHTLKLAVMHYRERLQDPQRLHDLYQAVWEYHGIELMGLSQKDTRVADVPYKEEDIWQFMRLENPQAGNPSVELGYFHLPVLASGDVNTRVLIGKGFSNLGAARVFQQRYEVINGHQTSGWMRVDASLDAPYRINKRGELTGLNVDELEGAIAADKRTGQTINIYGPSGNVIKQIFDYYPDQGSTWSRVPGSVRDGRVLHASFDPVGYFPAYSSWSHRGRYPGMGGRSFLGA